MNDIPVWLLLVLLLLLIFSAWLAGTEAGVMSLNRYRLKHLAKQQRSARRLYRLLKRRDRLTGSFMVGNSLVNTLAAMVAGLVAVRLYGGSALLPAALLFTLITVTLCNMVPRTLATRHPEQVAISASYLIKPLLKLLHPLARLASALSRLLLRVFGAESDTEASSIDTPATAGKAAGTGADSNGPQGMLINILDLEKVTVNDIMVPRNEIIGLDLEDDIEALVDRIVATEYTYLPLYEGDINNVCGLLHMRKVNRLMRRGEDSLSKESLKRFARDPYFIPESTSLQVQLGNFQKSGQRIALVVDEYGGILGLVTLQDILEEIVGKFTTNYAAGEQAIIANADHSYTLDAGMSIRAINKTLHWQLPSAGPRTLNGLLLERLEHIPEGNVCLQFSGYRFETLSLNDKMIDSVRMWRLPQQRVRSDEDEDSDD